MLARLTNIIHWILGYRDTHYETDGSEAELQEVKERLDAVERRLRAEHRWWQDRWTS